jgi:hypothetical protein
VILGFAVLSGFGIWALAERISVRSRIALALAPVLIIADLIMVPLPLDPMFPVSHSYRMLATLPRGPVAQFPFYWRNAELQHHAVYMLFSTYHWQPLINGYSDIFPPGFGKLSQKLATFPGDEALDELHRLGAKYIVVYYPRYREERREQIDAVMRSHGERFRELQRDKGVVLYQIVSW